MSISSETAPAEVPTDFRDAFWGEGGVDTLLQNAKQAYNSSKELEGFIRDRAKAEETFGKEMQKLSKHNAQIGTHVGTFAPAWMELVYAGSERLSTSYAQRAALLLELAKEVAVYHNHQKDQQRLTKEQAVAPCSDSMAAFNQLTVYTNKCKATFHKAHQEQCECIENISKLQREPHKQKELEKLESRLKKLETTKQQWESEYKAALQKQETLRNDFKDKMIVMADRLQKTEMDHLVQMKKFAVKLLLVERKLEALVGFFRKHEEKETNLSADLMVQQFVAVKGSGAMLAPALTFEAPPKEMPQISKEPVGQQPLDARASLESASMTSVDPKKKWLRKKKKDKSKRDKIGEKDETNADANSEANARGSQDANVDEEGYSIRPDDADRMGTKDDNDSDFSYGSGSEAEGGETESKLRGMSIKPIDASRNRSITSNSSDLTAAVQSLSILKPPSLAKMSSGENPSRSSPSPARNLIDEAVTPSAGGLMEPLGALPPAAPVSSAGFPSATPVSSAGLSLVAPVSSAGSATPSSTTKDLSLQQSPDSPQGDSPAAHLRVKASSASLPGRSSVQAGMYVYALLSETVNALFKGSDLSSTLVKITGELQLSFKADCIDRMGSEAAPLTIRLHPTSNVENTFANTHLLEKSTSTPDIGEVSYNFKMPALQAFLKAQRDAQPAAAFYKVDVFKYQARANSAAALPIHVNCLYKCEGSVSNLKVQYSYNNNCPLSPSPIKMVSFLTPTEGVANVQTNSNHQWANDRLSWKIPEIGPNTNASLLAKLDLKSGPGRPSPVAVQFTLEGHNLSGLGLDIPTAGYQLALLKHRVGTGKYMAEPAAR